MPIRARLAIIIALLCAAGRAAASTPPAGATTRASAATTTAPAPIASFQGEHRYLSSFWPAEVEFEGTTYPTVEHAYQAAKSADPADRQRIASLPTPADAKRAGRALKLRAGWETLKFEVMEQLVRQKFTRHAELREKLLATGEADLIEGNTWGDRVWGVYQGAGENRLGKILMKVRGELRDGPPPRPARRGRNNPPGDPAHVAVAYDTFAVTVSTAPPAPSFVSILQAAALPFALALVIAMLCYSAAGHSLGFYLGPVVGASLVVPPLVAGARGRLGAVIVAGSVIDGIGVVWLVRVLGADATLSQWLACYVVLAAFACALAGLTWVLRRTIGGLAASAVTIVLALAWLLWPIWTSPWITADGAAWLSPAHPLLAVNHAVLDLGVWTQQSLVYRYTALGQDVPYALPESVWPCVLLHGLIALGLLWPEHRRPARGPSSAPAAS